MVTYIQRNFFFSKCTFPKGIVHLIVILSLLLARGGYGVVWRQGSDDPAPQFLNLCKHCRHLTAYGLPTTWRENVNFHFYKFIISWFAFLFSTFLSLYFFSLWPFQYLSVSKGENAILQSSNEHRKVWRSFFARACHLNDTKMHLFGVLKKCQFLIVLGGQKTYYQNISPWKPWWHWQFMPNQEHVHSETVHFSINIIININRLLIIN